MLEIHHCHNWQRLQCLDAVNTCWESTTVIDEYFSSVFTTEDISSLPVPFTKFEGNKTEHLGQLFVTPERIAKKI